MVSEVFQKEADTLELAQEALANSVGMDAHSDKAFRALVKGYARLLRQSRRMVTMGDRIQQALNDLNREIAASESKYRGVFENVNEGIYRCAPDGTFVEVNPAMAVMFGFTDGEAFMATVQNIKELFCSHSDYERYQELLGSEGVHRHEVKACGPGEVTLWAEISASVLHDEEDQTCTGVVGVLADVTERKQMLEEMCRLARTDSLTSLWNRGYFMELANREVARCLRSGAPLSLLIVDVDYFKAVNDTYGHDVGDQALISLAKTLRTSVREVDVVGRHGGEEFVVLLPDANQEEAAVVSERIAEAVRRNIVECNDLKVPLTVSIGMASLQRGDDLDSILKFADIALYAAKKKGRDRVEVYQRKPQACDLKGCPKQLLSISGGGR
ncbi:sensor domain-containing diguanylate cyclase [Pseudodesulfovibrio sp. zrk46]|uniref:sensor domain-containing diguanylate cyclase n=1 Tax=Pseudodesulfovibrio sp. zrk46 TaxID=2725288 RepID=UPI0014496D5F|nr:sensor domain-containing diguanylate cyclase [Pseudodesulfovibrio sp. zrk46]QJB56936.1 diguanylate cyclase [Pseudodesulfovibrio sp. zrk46]